MALLLVVVMLGEDGTTDMTRMEQGHNKDGGRIMDGG